MTSSNYKTNYRTSWIKSSKNNPYHQILSVFPRSISINKFNFRPPFPLFFMMQKLLLATFHTWLFRILCLTTLTVTFQNCASSGFGTQGLLYEKQRISLMETGSFATKEGFSCAKSYLGLISFGDASVEEAQKQGNLKEITSIELETYNFLGIYAKLCTVTKGN